MKTEKKASRRFISLALVLSALVSVFAASCGETPSGTQDTGDGHDTAQTTEAADPDRFADVNFNGETVGVLCRTDTMLEWARELYAEDDGDIVNSAVFAKNRNVEERLGIHLNYIRMDGDWNVMSAFMQRIRESVNADDHEFDLVAGYRHYMPQLAAEGYFMNLNDVPYIDFTQPWWKGNFTSELNVGGKLHFMAGDIGLSMLKCLMVFFYNKNLAEQYDLENIYDVVKSGRWTVDYATQLCEIVSNDLNGDSKMDMEHDLYGYSTNHSQEYFDVLGSPFTTMDKDGYPVLTFNNAKTVSIVEKLYHLFYETDGCVPHNISTSSGGTYETSEKMFREDRLLMWSHCLCYAEDLRDMKSDFAVIPYFKWNEEQKEYHTATQNVFSIFSIVSNCAHPDVVGATAEVMAEESYKLVTPAYYEVALGDKYTRDTESKEMLSIIRDGVVFNFGTTYSIQLNGIYNTLSTILNSGNANFSSYYASNESTWLASLNTIIENYKGLD